LKENLFNLNSELDAGHLSSISQVNHCLGRVGSSSNQINQDVRDLWDDSLNGRFSTIHTRVERQSAALTLGNMIRHQELTDLRSGNQLTSVIGAGANVEAIDLETGDGEGDETLLLQVETESGALWDWFIESELSQDLDGGSGVERDGEGFNNNAVNCSWLVGAITESVFNLINLDASGGDQGERGESCEESHVYMCQ